MEVMGSSANALQLVGMYRYTRMIALIGFRGQTPKLRISFTPVERELRVTSPLAGVSMSVPETGAFPASRIITCEALFLYQSLCASVSLW